MHTRLAHNRVAASNTRRSLGVGDCSSGHTCYCPSEQSTRQSTRLSLRERDSPSEHATVPQGTHATVPQSRARDRARGCHSENATVPQSTRLSYSSEEHATVPQSTRLPLRTRDCHAEHCHSEHTSVTQCTYTPLYTDAPVASQCVAYTLRGSRRRLYSPNAAAAYSVPILT
jgi:hypothetical protein